jgi:hypothetical protein
MRFRLTPTAAALRSTRPRPRRPAGCTTGLLPGHGRHQPRHGCRPARADPSRALRARPSSQRRRSIPHDQARTPNGRRQPHPHRRGPYDPRRPSRCTGSPRLGGASLTPAGATHRSRHTRPRPGGAHAPVVRVDAPARTAGVAAPQDVPTAPREVNQPEGGGRVPSGLARWSDVGHAHADTRIRGVMPMVRVVSLLPRPNTSDQTATVSSVSSDRSVPVRAGEIGPIRREIIFEPVHEQPAPVEPAPVTPETEPKEPTPSRP